jgi:predicted TIM-barrel fold metal-dependent hydrolase
MAHQPKDVTDDESTEMSHHESILKDLTIVDADVHLDFYRFPEEVASYVESPYDDYLTNNPLGSPMTLDGWNRTMGGKIQPDLIESADALQERLCEDFHVDYPILNQFSYLPNYPDPDQAEAVAKGVNDMLLDKFLDHYDHFKGLAEVDPRKPDKAAEEIDRVGSEDDIVGLLLENGAELKAAGDPEFDPIYKAAEDNGLPVAYHTSAGSTFMQRFPINHQSANKFVQDHIIAHPFVMMETLTSLMVEGTPVKFPDLNFLILEAGIGWVPAWTGRMNKEISIRNIEAPLLEKSPEKYVNDQFLFGTQPIEEPDDPREYQMMIELLGEENVAFATDYPHWDLDHPDAVDKLVRNRFEPDQRDAIMGGNLASALGMNV